MNTKVELPMFCSLESQVSDLDASWIKLPDKIDFYLIFEFPQPWDRKIELSNQFPPKLRRYFQEIKDKGIKFKYLCINPENEHHKNNSKGVRILFYKNDPDDFVNFQKIELIIPSLELIFECVRSLVEGDNAYFDQFKIEINNTRDIFICTHGERDQCCGKFGVDIYNKLLVTTKQEFNVGVWKTSHMGGHRVSPTMLDMPSGRFWGYLTPNIIDVIIKQSGDHSKIVKNYRGMMGLDRYSQIAHKSIFELNGWKWFNRSVKSEILSQLTEEVRIQIQSKMDRQKSTFTATVRTVGTVSLPKSQCSKDTTLTKFKVINLKEESN